MRAAFQKKRLLHWKEKDEAEVEARQMAEAASRENQDCIVAEMEQEKMRRQEQMRQQKRQSSRQPRIIQQSALSRWWRFQEKN